MQTLLSLQKASWLTEKTLSGLTTSQLNVLKTYSPKITQIVDTKLIEIIKDQVWGPSEKAAVIAFVNKKQSFDPVSGKFEEQVFGKSVVMTYGEKSTVLESGGASYEFSNEPFPQRSDQGKFRNALYIFLNHSFSLNKGEIKIVGDIVNSRFPSGMSPILPEKYQIVKAMLEKLIDEHYKREDKTLSSWEFEKLIHKTLAYCKRVDRIALEDAIVSCFSAVPIKSREVEIWNPKPVIGTTTGTGAQTSTNSDVANAYQEFQRVIGYPAKTFKILPVLKIAYPKKANLEQILKLMQDYTKDMGGPSSSINTTFNNRSFSGRMSSGIRQLVVLCSVIEAVRNVDKRVIYVETSAGTVAILVETLKQRGIKDVKFNIPQKNRGSLKDYDDYLQSNSDIVTSGITISCNLAPLSTPKSGTDKELHFRQQLEPMMVNDVYIGSCLSPIAFDGRKVYPWFTNCYGYAVSVKGIDLKTRWTLKGREEVPKDIKWDDYLGRIVNSMLVSYQTVYAPLFKPEATLWSMILVGPSKGIQMNYDDCKFEDLITLTDESYIDQEYDNISEDYLPIDNYDVGTLSTSDKKPDSRKIDKAIFGEWQTVKQKLDKCQYLLDDGSSNDINFMLPANDHPFWQLGNNMLALFKDYYEHVYENDNWSEGMFSIARIFNDNNDDASKIKKWLDETIAGFPSIEEEIIDDV